MANKITGSAGRFGNHFIRAHAASFIAEKRGLLFNYGPYYANMKKLGISLYTNGTTEYKETELIRDQDLMKNIYAATPTPKNIDMNHAYFQTREFSNYLYQYYRDPLRQQPIIDANLFGERYHNNSDVFVHVRLDDAAKFNQGYAYYDKALSSIDYEYGYISSDTIHHPICRQLMMKYRLTPIQYGEVDTIMFGSTCKYIVLTGGTYSFMIGLLGFFSNVYYLQQFGTWHPAELFDISDWSVVRL